MVHPPYCRSCLKPLRSPSGEYHNLSTIRAGFTQPLYFDFNEAIKQDIRNMLRHSGFKPTGRNKLGPEYLQKALLSEWLSPQNGINAAVDVCNVISLHSGIPISVIDANKVTGTLRIAHLPKGSDYIFNPSGQILKGSGLLALIDDLGPTATPVKDAQRTKTDDTTTHT